MRRRHLIAAGAAAPVIAIAEGARAQSQQGAAFDRPLRIVIPYGAGGTSDILARLMQPELTRQIGQSVVVENRSGAAGLIGADAVGKSAPDGHTVLLMDPGIIATAPHLFQRLPFDGRSGLQPVAMLVFAPYILGVHPSVPARTPEELVAFARANPNRLNVAHSGVGTPNHLTAELVARHWGATLTMVPYRGGAPAMAAVAGGEAQMIVNGATAMQPFVQNDQMRAIALSGSERLPSMPDLQTFKDLGWPGTEAGTWQGIFVAPGTPAPMVARLEREFRAALAVPSVAQRVRDIGGSPRREDAAGFREWLVREEATWGPVIRAANVRMD